jgi:hypothetical protein
VSAGGAGQRRQGVGDLVHVGGAGDAAEHGDAQDAADLAGGVVDGGADAGRAAGSAPMIESVAGAIAKPMAAAIRTVANT